MVGTVHLCLDAHATLGEGPIWDVEQQVLYWVDILSGAVHVYDPALDQDRVLDVGRHVGTVVPRAGGGLMLALSDGFAAFDPSTETLTLLHDPEAHLPGNRFNDGKCGPDGRFWAGTMAYENQSTQGSLYRMDTDLTVHKVLGDIGISNGLAWSLDQGVLYYIDSIAYNVRAFDYDMDTGDIDNGRVVIAVPRAMGLPDGMTNDAEGMLWIAHFGGGKVSRWNPLTGDVIDQIRLPASQITACAFGGPELDTLYITSAAVGLDDDALSREPHAGGIFATKPGVRGVPAFKFGG